MGVLQLVALELAKPSTAIKGFDKRGGVVMGDRDDQRSGRPSFDPMKGLWVCRVGSGV